MDIVILDIFDFLEVIDIQSYIHTHILGSTEKKYFIQKKIKWIDENIPNIVQKIFPNHISCYPFIKFQNHFLDEINYIRYVYSSDFKSPVVIGIDSLNRPFIVIKYQETIHLPLYHITNSQIKSLVLFSHFGSNWSSCSPYEGSLFSKDKYRKYLVYDQTYTSVTYKRLSEMYEGHSISILENNIQYLYKI